MKTTWLPIVIGGMLLQPLAFADDSYQETTQVTSGSLQGMLQLAGALFHGCTQVPGNCASEHCEG